MDDRNSRSIKQALRNPIVGDQGSLHTLAALGGRPYSSLLPKPEQATARAIYSLLVGTLQLARNAPDAKQPEELQRRFTRS